MDYDIDSLNLICPVFHDINDGGGKALINPKKKSSEVRKLMKLGVLRKHPKEI